jgi:hypothetical protein
MVARETDAPEPGQSSADHRPTGRRRARGASTRPRSTRSRR